MIEIVTKTNSFVLNGIQYAKNDLTVQPTTTGVKIGHFAARLEDVTIDGATFSNREDLMDALDSSIFKKGGGDGDGVTQEELDERVTVLEQGDFLAGGENGNEGRRIKPDDVGLLDSNRFLFRNSQGEFSSVSFTGTPASGIVPLYSSSNSTGGAGRLKSNNAVDGNDVVALSQFQGVVNDTLTSSETSSTLNSAYPSVVVGTIVTSETGLVEYRKFSPTTWRKLVIEIV